VGLDTQVLGISVDHQPCLVAWAESLGGISYPLLSDFWPHGKIAKKYGVFRDKEGKSERAIFVLDKEGIIRYIDIHDIDKQPDNQVLFDVLRKVDPEAAAREPKKEEPEAQPLPDGGIVMYCTKWCPGCVRARRWFEERGLEYVEVDVNTVPGAVEQVMAWNDGDRTTPTFNIDGEIVTNWREAKLIEALKLKGYPIEPKY
jgi:glutaredoxin